MSIYNKDELKYKNPEARRIYHRNYSRSYMKSYKLKNPDKIKLWEKNRRRIKDPIQKKLFLEWQRKRRREWKKRLIDIKKKIGKCKYCWWDKKPEVLQFHHRDKSKKEFKFSVGNLGNKNWEKLLKEIEKCDLICPNCHFSLHYDETAYK